MPTSSLGDIPSPADTDPLAGAAAAIRAVVAKLDQVCIVKTGVTTKNNSTSLTTDSELSFLVEAGATVAFEFHLIFTTGNSAIDAKLAVERSVASGDLTWFVAGLDPAAGAGSVGDAAFGGVYHGTSGDTVSVGVSSGVTGANIFGTYTAVADTIISLRWAQNTATAADLNLCDGSYVKAQVCP